MFDYTGGTAEIARPSIAARPPGTVESPWAGYEKDHPVSSPFTVGSWARIMPTIEEGAMAPASGHDAGHRLDRGRARARGLGSDPAHDHDPAHDRDWDRDWDHGAATPAVSRSPAQPGLARIGATTTDTRG